MCYNSENRLRTLFLDSMWHSDNFWETFEDIKRGKEVRISVNLQRADNTMAKWKMITGKANKKKKIDLHEPHKNMNVFRKGKHFLLY